MQPNEFKITKLTITGNPVVGDLNLDFTKQDGTPYSNIVFAGENGVGKTTILTMIDSLLTSYKQINNKDTSAQQIPNVLGGNICAKIKNITTGVEYDITNGQGIVSLRDNKAITQPESIYALNLVPFTLAHRDVIKEKVQTTIDTIFRQEQAAAYSNMLLHIDDLSVDHVKQESILVRLLTFLRETFNLRLAPRSATPSGNSPKIEIINRDTKKPFSINDLSSGEREILFRALYVLDSTVGKPCNFILIDEPELSLHPKWQEKILKAYKSLITVNRKQEIQLFSATHSDHVLKSAIEDDDTLIIKLERGKQPEKIFKNCGGEILPRITLSEIKWRMFDIETLDFHIELFGALQNREQKNVGALDTWLSGKPNVPQLKNLVPVMFNNHTDLTLPTYIRNHISHPNGGRNESCLNRLRESIAFMAELLRNP